MQVSFDFTGKVAVITGGATGIGRATAVEFAKAGAKVVVGDIDDRAAETVQIITDANGTAEFVKTDVTDDASVKTSSTLPWRSTALSISPSIMRESCRPPHRYTSRPLKTGIAH